MDASEALAELRELSAQVERAVVLGEDGAVLGSLPEGAEGRALADAALELAQAAEELRSGASEATRIEVELAEGALFVVREGGRTVAATTGPGPTSGLVVYDLRTCLQRLAEEEAEKRSGRRGPRARRTPAQAEEPSEPREAP